jgi:hypothetical protein
MAFTMREEQRDKNRRTPMVRSNAALKRELDKLKKAAKALVQKAETWAYCLFNNLSNRISDPEGAGLRD